MNRQGRVLVVDDLEPWREQLVEMLQYEGFHADSASTVTEVLQHLDETFYHILILDIRLVDADPLNEAGIELLDELDKRGLSEAMKVIILSAYGTKDQMRVAFRNHRVADFLSKEQFTKKMFLESVRQALARDARINLDLIIHWQEVSGAEQVVANLEIGGTRIKRDLALRSRIALELEDLLCRLFDKAHSVLVRPIVQGQSVTGVLWVQPFYASGAGRAMVVKFGDFRKVEEEYAHFKEYVEPFISGGRNSAVYEIRRTPYLGGILYSFLGADNERLEDFGSFYSHASEQQIINVLDRLFLDTCSAWYANAGQLQPYNLTEDYQRLLGFTLEKFERPLLELRRSVQGTHRLYFKSLNSGLSFKNPILAMDGPPFVRTTYTCITHGDFNQHNLFIDQMGHTWLIDFLRTGPGHILRDVAQMDSEIRFVLLAPEEATLEERLCLEEKLCSIDRFSQVEQLMTLFPTENQTLAKVYTTVVHLRILARKLVSQNPGDDMSEYYIALFYNAVNILRFPSLAVRQREHALLSASLLADRLGLKG